MSSKFDANSSIAKNRPTERLFVEVTKYDLAKTTGFVTGRNLITGEVIDIRLNTVDERLSDRPSDSKKSVDSAYVSGAYARETLEKKHNRKSNILVFDDCVSIEGPDKTITAYRSHWPTAMSAESTQIKILEAEAMHIKLKKGLEEGSRDTAYVEVVHPSVKAEKDNVDHLLSSIFSNKDEDGNPAHPAILLDLRFKGGAALPNLPRIYPDTVQEAVYDSATGGMKSISITAPAEVTVKRLLDGSREPKNGRDAINLDYFRAVIAAVKGEEQPDPTSPSAKVRSNTASLYQMVKDKTIDVHLGKISTYSFGPQARKTYINEADKKHMSGFHVNRKNGEEVRPVAAFAHGVVALGQFEDGTYYVRDAKTIEAYPSTKPLNEMNLSTVQSPKVIFENKIAKQSELIAEKDNKQSLDNSDDNRLQF